VSTTSPPRAPFALEVDLSRPRGEAALAAPAEFGAITVHERHVTVDRSRVHLGDLFYAVDGAVIRFSADPSALAGPPALTDHLLHHLLARTLDIRGEVDRTALAGVRRLPARGVTRISPEMARGRCAPFPWAPPRVARGRRAREVEARLAELAGAVVGDTLAVSGGISSAFLHRCAPGARTLTIAPQDVALTTPPLVHALAVAPARSLASGLGLRPLFTASRTSAVVDKPRRGESGAPARPVVPWLTAAGARVAHDLLESSRHSWETWLSEVDGEEAGLAWSWSAPDVGAVVTGADRLGVAHRSPAQVPEFVELARALPRTARSDLAFLRRDAAPGTLVSSGEQRVRRLAVDRADARAGRPLPTLVLADAGLVDPNAFAAVLAHPFLREQHALALIRTLEVEQWLSTR